MIRHIYLHGSLQKFSATPIDLDVDSPTMLLRGLESQFPGFRKELMAAHEICLLKQTGDDQFQSVTEQTWEFPFSDADTIHIIPRVEGQGFEIAVMMGFAAGTVGYYVVGTIVSVALSYAFAAVSAMLAPSPKAGNSERADDTPSFIFNGAVNVVEEGYPVPLVYGEVITGSVVISVGSEPEDMIQQPEYNWDYYFPF
jgi:predicted phage tail protein